jgi:hypothetical protein
MKKAEFERALARQDGGRGMLRKITAIAALVFAGYSLFRSVQRLRREFATEA